MRASRKSQPHSEAWLHLMRNSVRQVITAGNGEQPMRLSDVVASVRVNFGELGEFKDRDVDRALQRLRKADKVQYHSKHGWMPT